MKKATLTISQVDRLNHIQRILSADRPIAAEDRAYLSDFLSQLPDARLLLAEGVPLDRDAVLELWDTDKLERDLEAWKALFDNIPGYDYVGCLPAWETPRLLQQGIILTVTFSPTYSYNQLHDDGPEIWLYENGSARFSFSRLQDAERYPDLYNFRGGWTEAYRLLIDTLKKGWPVEGFPEELKPFLKK